MLNVVIIGRWRCGQMVLLKDGEKGNVTGGFGYWVGWECYKQMVRQMVQLA